LSQTIITVPHVISAEIVSGSWLHEFALFAQCSPLFGEENKMNDWHAEPRRTLMFTGALLSTLLLGTMPLSAQEVTLKSADGTVDLTGQLVKFENGNYVVATDLGDLSISASRVRCEGEACPKIDVSDKAVKIVGSDTIGAGIMPLLMGGYATYLDAESSIQNTATKGQFLAAFVGDQGFGDAVGSYLVTSTASRDAFTGLVDKSGDIGMSSRRITPEEAHALKAAGAGNMIDPKQEHIIAVDSLVVIVNQDNPVTAIKLADLAKIFAGQMTNWSEIGGPDLPIQVITRKEGSGTLSVFQSKIYAGTAPAGPADQIAAADNSEAAAFVNATPGAIAFVGYAFQRGAKAMPLINECGIETRPDAFSGKTEEYAIQRRLYLYSRGDVANDLITKFLDFTISPIADQVVAQAGFVDFGIITRSQDADSARAMALTSAETDAYEAGIGKEMLTEMEGTMRLSSTFRFRTGSNKLDDRARRDMARLLDYLKALPEGTQVIIAGFSDNAGEFEPNRDLSKGRADLIAKELVALAGDQLANIAIETRGFGEIAPVSCNESEAGRQSNRRVEIWVTQS
jgi:phosphate transport system substrate-binding protein